jgi:hypothetical protein
MNKPRCADVWNGSWPLRCPILSKILNDTNLTEMETCYKAFTSDCLKAIPLESDRFGIEPEITS